MKRIIDCVTYNTDTATLIAKAEKVDAGWENNTGGDRQEFVMYQTRGGAFFVHVHTTTLRRNPSSGNWEQIERDVFEPMDRDLAQQWVLEEGEVELVSDVFGEPPEAAAEADQGGTIYVRVPGSLKARIDAAAKAANLSVNSWVMRCVETCAKPTVDTAEAKKR